MTKRPSLQLIKELLQAEPPGKDAQLRMAPEGREQEIDSGKMTKAAVLILLYEENGKLKTVFIKRNVYDGAHSGQISLPGGVLEASDASLWETAIREAEEEVGVRRKDLNYLGVLSELHIPVSSFIVTPFVAYLEYVPEFILEKSEVQYLIETDLDSFFGDKNIRRGLIKSKGYSISSPYYLINNEIIWGATAMIISEFTAALGY